jgi:hypothetical protein
MGVEELGKLLGCPISWQQIHKTQLLLGGDAESLEKALCEGPALLLS